MYIQDKEEWEYHRKTFGEHTKFGYKDFIQMFQAEKFDPKQWAKLFKAAGAKYVFPVAEHHDGFQMYKSEISKYNAFDMGPKRDLLGELREAIEEENLMFGSGIVGWSVARLQIPNHLCGRQTRRLQKIHGAIRTRWSIRQADRLSVIL